MGLVIVVWMLTLMVAIGNSAPVFPVQGINIFQNMQYNYGTAGGKLRVEAAHGIVIGSNLDTGTDTDVTTRDYAHSLGLTTDDAGHILADRLGGSGKDPVNIFPQSPTINRGVYRIWEARIYDCVNSTLQATLDWVFHYSSPTETRPISVDYCATIKSIGSAHS